MISIADLNDLATRPQVAYDGYDELRSVARARNGGLTDPQDIPRMQEIIRRRGGDWCQSVIGTPMMGGLRSISATDADMLLVADERGLTPPMPAWLRQWTDESAETRRRRDEGQAAALERDRRRWDDASATCAVQVEVRENMNHGRRYGSLLSGPLRHAVPVVDARSSRRRHQAGRALCETPRRSKPLQLGEPTGDPATCKSCITYTAGLQPAETGAAS